MEVPVSSSLGAMGPLLRKLDSLRAPDGSKLPELLKSRIEDLKMDLLDDIVTPLEELLQEKAPDLTSKYWMTEVRELSYDIEDSIDEMALRAHADAAAATKSCAVSLRCRVRRAKIPWLLPRKLKRRTWFAKVAMLRTALVWEAIDRHERYLRKDEFVFSAQPPDPAQLGEAKATNLVGINSSTADEKEKVPMQRKPSAQIGEGSGSSRRVFLHRKQANNRTRRTSEKQEMYQQHDGLISQSTHHLLISSRHRYGETSNLVGMDEAMIQLSNWLRCEEKQTLKVKSIVGPGGIGKSTVAKELYREHGGQFICRAFVQASRKPNIRKLLWDILSQIQCHQRPTRSCEVQHLIHNIRRHLQDKRYFIVIDDVWQTTVWDFFASAFPESNNCSRIIITTEMEDVALECGGYQPEYIFKMKPLGNVDSAKLFTSVVFGSKSQKSNKELDKASYEITRKIGGLPFATTIVSRFLAMQQAKLGTSSHIQDLLYTTLTSSGSEDLMKAILHFCYDNLPQHLKTCLLYLSMYPEGYIISKADLVKQWMAEGFICTIQGKSKEEIAESYFNELVNIKLIHPNRIKYTDGVMSCTVHHMVLDMIKYKSKEVNFTTVTDHPRITAGLSTKVRRLSLQLSSTKHASQPATVTMPHVRSLTYFGLLECLPLVASFKFKHIRVIVIEIWGENTGWTSLDFTRISALLHLIYLKITSDVMVQLPDKISGLQHLESLEVDARVSSVPSDIIRLPRLSQLRIKDEIKLPDGIGCIRSLRTLQYFDLARNSKKNVRSLGELSNLRDLHLTCSTVGSEEHLNRKLVVLSCSLGKLRDLCSLTLAPGALGAGRIPLKLEGSATMCSVPVWIQRLKLLPPICIVSRLPNRMGRLRELRVLKIAVRELLGNDINHLSELPALAVLSLHVRVVRVGTVIIERGSFLSLRYFQFRSSVLSMAFRAGAMPSLQSLKLGFKAQAAKQYGRMLGGVEHLQNLQEITGEIAIATGAGESDRRAAQRAFDDAIKYSSQKWNAVSEHPVFPRVRVKLADWMVVEEAFAHHVEGSGGQGTTSINDLHCENLPFDIKLLPKVISFTSPLDACRCLAVCTAFRAEASRDEVWERFIPTDYMSILSRAVDPVDVDFASTKKELFTNLSEQRFLIDEGKKSFWLDRTTGAKSYMLAARSLYIIWGEAPQYWRWIGLPGSRFEEVAELVDVCWLDINGTIDCRDLSPNKRYTAYLVFNLTDRSHGLDSPKQEACITIAGVESERHTVSLYPHPQQHRSRVGSSAHNWSWHNSEDEVEDWDPEHEDTEEEDEDEDEDEYDGYEETEEDEDEEQDDEVEDEDTEDEEKEGEAHDIEVEENEDDGDQEKEEEEEEEEEDNTTLEDGNDKEEEEGDDDDDEDSESEEEDSESEEVPPSVRGSSEERDLNEYEQIQELVRYPKARDDGWMEVELGKFYVENLDDGEVVICLQEHERNWKSGLIVEGIEIRPVIGCDKPATTN